MNNNNENIEEVPLDLFDQVSLEEDDSIEIVDLETTNKEEQPSGNVVISIPADAYEKAMAELNNSSDSQSN